VWSCSARRNNGAVTLIASVGKDHQAKVQAGKIIQTIAPLGRRQRRRQAGLCARVAAKIRRSSTPRSRKRRRCSPSPAAFTEP
jgi:hypothetical protein